MIETMINYGTYMGIALFVNTLAAIIAVGIYSLNTN